MPIYEYHCDACNTSFEILQKMSDEPLRTCDCGGELRKVLHPIAIHFKGSGFYSTDYGKGSVRSAKQTDDSSSPTMEAIPTRSSSDASSSTASTGGSSAVSSSSSAPSGEKKNSTATKGA